MELRHIYQIADAIIDNVFDIPKSNNQTLKSIDDVNDTIQPQRIPTPLDDMVITIKVSPSTHYGIDREFYRLTHNDSIEGFVHQKGPIDAKIDGVNFIILEKEEKPKSL